MGRPARKRFVCVCVFFNKKAGAKEEEEEEKEEGECVTIRSQLGQITVRILEWTE